MLGAWLTVLPMRLVSLCPLPVQEKLWETSLSEEEEESSAHSSSSDTLLGSVSEVKAAALLPHYCRSIFLPCRNSTSYSLFMLVFCLVILFVHTLLFLGARTQSCSLSSYLSYSLVRFFFLSSFRLVYSFTHCGIFLFFCGTFIAARLGSYVTLVEWVLVISIVHLGDYILLPTKCRSLQPVGL